MTALLAGLVTAGVAAYLGFWAGVRRERGRAALLAEILSEAKAVHGVRLKSMKIRR